MKRIAKKSLVSFMLCCLLGGLVSVQPVKAEGNYMGMTNKMSWTYSTNKKAKELNKMYLTSMKLYRKLKGAKNIKAASSKTNVATVKYDKRAQVFVVTPKKAGTTKITVSAVVKGKTIKDSSTIKFYKYSCPFSSLKISGKEYAKKFNRPFQTLTPYKIAIKGNTAKITFKLKKGWKLNRYSTVTKSGKSVKVTSKGTYVNLILENKSTGQEDSMMFLLKK